MTCTVYLSTGERLYISGAHWEETRGENINNTGSNAVNNVWVYLPISAPLPNRLTGVNYIVKGQANEMSSAEVVKSGKAYTITSAEKCDYGSPRMHHWEVYAK